MSSSVVLDCLCCGNRATFLPIIVYSRVWRCTVTFFNTSSREPGKTRILVSIAALAPGAKGICGSTCWQVSSGLLHTLSVVLVKLATTHLPSVETVATNGSSTERDLL
jgi:hypothetical protein